VKKSEFNRIKIRPNVLVVNPHIQSRAAFEKLSLKLFHARTPSKIRPQWRQWLSFRKWYFRQKLKEGPLACHFCDTVNLKVNTFGTPKKLQATIDHFLPRAKGGREYHWDNLVVCCRVCNAKKADKLDFKVSQND